LEECRYRGLCEPTLPQIPAVHRCSPSSHLFSAHRTLHRSSPRSPKRQGLGLGETTLPSPVQCRGSAGGDAHLRKEGDRVAERVSVRRLWATIVPCGASSGPPREGRQSVGPSPHLSWRSTSGQARKSHGGVEAELEASGWEGFASANTSSTISVHGVAGSALSPVCTL